MLAIQGQCPTGLFSGSGLAPMTKSPSPFVPHSKNIKVVSLVLLNLMSHKMSFLEVFLILWWDEVFSPNKSLSILIFFLLNFVSSKFSYFLHFFKKACF
jgi:hypothetical protein